MKGHKAQKEGSGAGQAAKDEQVAQFGRPKGIEIVVDNQRNGQHKDAHKATDGQLAGVNVLRRKEKGNFRLEIAEKIKLNHTKARKINSAITK